MVGWKETFEVLPAILVVGVSFALTQFFWSNYVDSNLVDIMGGVVSIIAVVRFFASGSRRKSGALTTTKRKPSAAARRSDHRSVRRRMEAGGVRRIRQAAVLLGRASFASLDAFRHPVAVRASLGTAHRSSWR